MAPTYVSSAPLVVVKDRSGVDHYAYRGQPIAGDFDPDRLKALADEGLIAAREAPAPAAAEPEPLTEAPPKSAAKDVWVAWAVQNGADEAEAKKAKKDDLIASYGDVTLEPGSEGDETGDQA